MLGCLQNHKRTEIQSLNYWAIGFLWGNSRFSSEYLLVQNRDKERIEVIKEVVEVGNKIFPIKTRQDNTSWVLKIPLTNSYVVYMVENEHLGRNESIDRDLPKNLTYSEEYEFFKGYFSLHFTLDIVTIRNKQYKRLRFYASKAILESLNEHLHKNIGTTIKKIQNTKSSDHCHILCYASKYEIPTIIDYLQLEIE